MLPDAARRASRKTCRPLGQRHDGAPRCHGRKRGPPLGRGAISRSSVVRPRLRPGACSAGIRSAASGVPLLRKRPRAVLCPRERGTGHVYTAASGPRDSPDHGPPSRRPASLPRHFFNRLGPMALAEVPPLRSGGHRDLIVFMAGVNPPASLVRACVSQHLDCPQRPATPSSVVSLASRPRPPRAGRALDPRREPGSFTQAARSVDSTVPRSGSDTPLLPSTSRLTVPHVRSPRCRSRPKISEPATPLAGVRSVVTPRQPDNRSHAPTVTRRSYRILPLPLAGRPAAPHTHPLRSDRPDSRDISTGGDCASWGTVSAMTPSQAAPSCNTR